MIEPHTLMSTVFLLDLRHVSFPRPVSRPRLKFPSHGKFRIKRYGRNWGNYIIVFISQDRDRRIEILIYVGEGRAFSKEAHRQKAQIYVNVKKPKLLKSSPACTIFRDLQQLRS